MADERSAAPQPNQPPRTSAELQQLKRGEITLDEYLDSRAERAVKHLGGQVSAEQLEFVRQLIRDQLTTDPILVELVGRTTGATRRTERP